MIDPLLRAPPSVFAIWNFRKRIELEAAAHFRVIAEKMRKLYGPTDELSKLAIQAEKDEIRHAALCDKILDYSLIRLEPPKIDPSISIGQESLDERDQLLYACVAVGCITETLSTALLIEMREVAAAGLVKSTIHEILTDEVNHSRIGWGELARASETRNLSWLSFSIVPMLQHALHGEVGPMLDPEQSRQNISIWGILTRQEAQGIVSRAIRDIIIPGLEKFGVESRALSQVDSSASF